MPVGKFTLPNIFSQELRPTLDDLLGGQLPEYEPGVTGGGYTGALEEPAIGEMDLLMAVAPFLRLGKLPLKALANQRGSLSGKKIDDLITKITGEATHKSTVPKRIQADKAEEWLKRGWIKGPESTMAGGTKVVTVYPPESKYIPQVDLKRMELNDALDYMKKTKQDIPVSEHKELHGLKDIAKKKLEEERGSFSRFEVKPIMREEKPGNLVELKPEEVDWQGIFRGNMGISNLLKYDKDYNQLYYTLRGLPNPDIWKFRDVLESYKKLGPEAKDRLRFLYTDYVLNNPKRYPDLRKRSEAVTNKFPNEFRMVEFPDELEEVSKYKDLWQIVADEKDLLKYSQYIDPKLREKYMESKSKGILGTVKDIVKSERGSFSNKPLEGAISKGERDKIITNLITTPERAELLNPQRRHLLEAALQGLPEGSKAHLFGSIVSKKPNPKDVDVLVELPTGRLWHDIMGNPQTLPVIPKVDLTPAPPLERVPANVKKILSVGRERYGPNYDFIRILSLLGAGVPLSQILESEK